jgi:uncharacterized membrane protein YdbT with pleckstrin-like domain
MNQSDHSNPVDKMLDAASDPSMKQPVKEELLWTGGFVAKAMIGWWINCLIITIALVVLGFFSGSIMGENVNKNGVWTVLGGIILLVWLIVAFVYMTRRIGVSYELTTQRLIHRHGILTRTTDRVELIEIEDVAFTQGLVERMLNVGKIRVASSDRSHPILNMLGIADVGNVSNMIDNARRAERRRRALMINQGS